MKMQVLIVATAALAACSHPTTASKAQGPEEAELQKAAEQYNASRRMPTTRWCAGWRRSPAPG